MPSFSLRTTWLRTLGKQLGHPSGPLGALVARVLNKGNRPVIEAAVEALDLAGGEQVADIGFGGGVGLDLLLARLGGGHVHGVDPSTSMVARARRGHRADLAHGRLTVREGAMEDLPFADAELDGWISLNTIYFAADLAPAFRELRRVLGPAGRGVLGVADPEWMATQSFAQHGFTIRPLGEVVALLTEAGLTVEQREIGDDRATAPYHLLVCRPAA